MMQKMLFVATAVGEGSTGLLLLAQPALVTELLLGPGRTAAEGQFMGRVAGAALLAIGVTSWFARNEPRSPAQLGVLRGLITYNSAAGLVLALTGAIGGFSGLLLWPAVAVHVAFALWCVACARQQRAGNVHAV